MCRVECSPLDLLTYTLAAYPLYVALELPEWDLENSWLAKPHVPRTLFAQVSFSTVYRKTQKNYLLNNLSLAKPHVPRTLFAQVLFVCGKGSECMWSQKSYT